MTRIHTISPDTPSSNAEALANEHEPMIAPACHQGLDCYHARHGQPCPPDPWA